MRDWINVISDESKPKIKEVCINMKELFIRTTKSELPLALEILKFIYKKDVDLHPHRIIKGLKLPRYLSMIPASLDSSNRPAV